MPNQNLVEAQGELEMAHCDVNVSYPCKAEETLCRIYTNTSWCSTCDKNSPCKRSKIDLGQEPCRRRVRDKSISKKCEWNEDQERENMELGYDGKDSVSNAVRWDRIRSNLCELPTTYISNNCLKVSNQDYLDSNSEKTFKSSEYNPNFGTTMVDRQDKLSKILPKIDETTRNINGIVSKMKQIDAKKLKPIISIEPHFQQICPFTLPQDELGNRIQHSMFANSSTLADLNFRETNESSIHYDTCTFLDKKIDVSNLREQYNQEVELLKGKLQCLKQNGCVKPKRYISPIIKQNNPKVLTIESSDCLKKVENNDSITICKVDAAKIPEDLSLLIKKANTKKQQKESLQSSSKVSVKTKPKAVSLKCRKQKITKSVVTNSELSDSDCSDSEASLKNVQESDTSDEVSSTSSSRDISAAVSGSGDSLHWPVRASLFPFIPPYLTFTDHDSQVIMKYPTGGRHLKWKLSTITPVILRKILVNSGFRLVRKSNEWVGTWGKHMKSPMFQTLKDTQKLNHFPGTFQVGRKDRLWRNFQRHILKHGYKEFGFTPQTYVLPQDLKLLKQHWQSKNGNGEDTYIIKPPAAARGTGIKVINRWSQLPKRMSLVVQEYISNPFLINNSKFDLRLYVLVTSFNPLRIYLYPEGLARFASVPYSGDPKDLRDRFMHLTNYSINKLSTLYTANEDANACKGHKWTLTKLWEYMSKRGINTKALWKNLQQLVIKTILTAESSISYLSKENMSSRYNCYELFGVDVLIDEYLKCWLLEVNISPSLHSQSSLDEHVKGPLVKSLLNLVQFHLPPKLKRTEAQGVPPCYDSRLYTTTLTKKEIAKHNLFCQVEARHEYLEEMLLNLTGDDVRFLTQAEDELTVIGEFERIFPTSQTFKYFSFMEVRYYNRLFDAWEHRYEKCREPGIKVLQSLCEQKLHLKIAPPPVLNKSLPNLIPSEANPVPATDTQAQNVTNKPALPAATEAEKPDKPLVEGNITPSILQLLQQANGSSTNHMTV